MNDSGLNTSTGLGARRAPDRGRTGGGDPVAARAGGIGDPPRSALLKRFSLVGGVSAAMVLCGVPLLLTAAAGELAQVTELGFVGWLIFFGAVLVVPGTVGLAVGIRKLRGEFCGLQNTLAELREDSSGCANGRVRTWPTRQVRPPPLNDNLPSIRFSISAQARTKNCLATPAAHSMLTVAHSLQPPACSLMPPACRTHGEDSRTTTIGGRHGAGWLVARNRTGRPHPLRPLSAQLLLKPGDRGFCFVRQNIDGEMVLTTYGRSTGFCVDPIEKKPLNHFLPGTAVLSFGTAGCNLGCKFCQNWDISKSREVERASESAEPETIAEAAVQLDCHSVAFTYNDPVIWAEYAIDTARACHARGIKTVAVTAGYITPAARSEFYEVMDAANVDLKAFSEEFYSAPHLFAPAAGARYAARGSSSETDVWFEITNLIIPQRKRFAGRNPPHVRLDAGSRGGRGAGALHGVPSGFSHARPSGHAAGDAAGGLRHRPSRRASSTSTWATCTIRATTARTVPSVRRC